MKIRHSEEKDIARIMEIYGYARDFMKKTGNPKQWGATNWPPEPLIRQDIRTGHSYVCEEDGRVVGTFYFYQGKEAEPGYAAIEDGAWIGGDEYGVVHRVAGDGSVKGIGTFCLNWAYGQCGHLRIDTHPDNKVMQSLLEKLGFPRHLSANRLLEAVNVLMTREEYRRAVEEIAETPEERTV